MARFLGVGVQTDILVAVPVGTTPATVAFFRPEDLVSCVAVLSPTEPESLTVQVRRDDSRADDLVLGRVLRVTHVGGTGDTEWDIVRLEDTSSADVLTVTCAPILHRLARVVYMGANAATGAAEPDWAGVQLTATEWLDALVIPQLAAAGIPFELGTVDSTARFTMDDEWTTLLEIVRAIAAPGRANAEVRLSAGGDYGYVLDLLDAIGGSADTVHVRTAVNLLELRRERALIDVATRLAPRGSSASVATRTMADHDWRIASVVSGTVLALEDPAGGDGPFVYDDQLLEDDLYLAVAVDETFASQQVTDVVAATQRVTVASTAGMSAGMRCRFYRGSGANAARLTSLTHPTLVRHAADGGYGDRALILDRPAIVGDANLVPNAMLRAGAGDWTEYASDTADGVFSLSSGTGPVDGLDAIKYVLATGGGRVPIYGAYTGGADSNAVQGPAVAIRSPAAQPWNTAGRTHVATIWLKVTAAPTAGSVKLYLHDGDRAGAAAYEWDEDGGIIGEWVKGTDDEGVWIRFESDALDLNGLNPGGTSAALNGRFYVTAEIGTTGTVSTADPAGIWRGRWNAGTSYAVANDYVSYNGVVYRATTVPTTAGVLPSLLTEWASVGTPNRRADTGWEIEVSAVTLAEAATAIADRENSGGTQLWQEANAALPAAVTAIKGYDLTIADLAADDPTVFASLAFTPGGDVEVIDTDLGVTTTLRLVEYTRDYLRPLDSRIRVGNPPDRLTDFTDALRAAA